MKGRQPDNYFRKLHRKIGYLRSMNKPNVEDGATKLSWAVFWKVLFKLQLTRKLHHYF